MSNKLKNKKGKTIVKKRGKTKVYKIVALTLSIITLASTVLTAVISFGVSQPQINYEYNESATPATLSTPFEIDNVVATSSNINIVATPTELK